MAVSRNWCFTVNNYKEEDQVLFKECSSCRYMVYGRETGEEGTPHLQGYIVWEGKKSLKQMKQFHGTAHWEIAKGDSEQNRVYCTKQGDYVEVGIQPLTQKRKGEVESERWDTAKKAAIAGDLDAIPSDMLVRYYRTFKEIKKDYMAKPDDAEGTTGVWIQGPSGCGKSRGARLEYPGSYFKLCNKWWDGYQGEENVIIDDVGKDHACLGQHFKIWGDRYSFLAETKGGALHIRPKRIIITSQYRMSEIWDDAETLAALTRRYSVKDMFPPVRAIDECFNLP